MRKINYAFNSGALSLKEEVNLFSTENEEAEIKWDTEITKF